MTLRENRLGKCKLRCSMQPAGASMYYSEGNFHRGDRFCLYVKQ
jgi:hypothetical protein